MYYNLLPPCSLYLESMVDVEGIVSAAPEKIKGCTQQDVEIQVSKVDPLAGTKKKAMFKYLL